MASILNTLDCANGAKNTGFGSCVLDPKNIIGVIEVPKGDYLSAANLASQSTLYAALLAKVTLDSPLLRWYPVWNLEAVTVNAGEPVVQTLGYGGKYVVRDDYYDLMFQFVQGGLCLLKNLRSHNGAGKNFFFIDREGLIIGTKVGDKLYPVPMQIFYAHPFKMNDGANISAYNIQFVFQQRYINELVGFAHLPFSSGYDVTNVAGLQDVSVEAFSTLVAGVVKVQFFVGCDHTNLYDAFSAVLATKANLLVKNKITGGLITITTDVVDAANKAFTLTLDTADADYPAVGQDLTIQLQPPSVLSAAGMPGYESNTLTLTV